MNSKWMVLFAAFLSACPQPVKNPCLENPQGCDESDAGVSDAGVIDGGNLKNVDWVDRRGEPRQLVESGLLSGKPFGVSATSLVVERNCDGGACDYEWRGDDGALLNTRNNLQPVATGFVTSDSKFLSALQLDERTTCSKDNGDTMQLFRGSWRHVSMLDGSVAAEAPIVSSDFIDESFTAHGGLSRVNLVDPATCETTGPKYRSTRAPFDEPLVLRGEPVTTWLEAELADGRFLLSLPPEKLVLVSPDDSTAWEKLSDAAFDFRSDGEFVHVVEGYPARELISADVVTRVTKRVAVPSGERDWFLMSASNRFAVLRSHVTPDGMVVGIFDGRGEFALREVRVGRFEASRPLAVAGRAHFAVFFDHETQLMKRIDLETGVVDTLPMSPGVVTPVADGRGVVLQSVNEFWVITAHEQLQVQDRPVGFVDAETMLLITVSGSGGSNGLTAWHVPSGRVVRLTNSLNFNMPFGGPISSGARCETPGFIRAAGSPSESTKQASTIHFTEFVPSAASRERLFEVPADLSAEPRLLVDVPQGQCGTPLRAVDGGRFWVPLPGAEGTVRVLVSPHI
ncbi:MAG: hypothetical protein ACO1OB_31435 [Archangium sp.]